MSVLTTCDNEPVRFINMIQSFGALITLDQEGKVISYSDNTEAITGRKISLGETYSPIVSSHLQTKTTRHLEKTFIEIEPGEDKESSSQTVDLDDLTLSGSLAELLQKTAKAVTCLTGFDRVMIYKFHEDLHGEVVAEEISQGTESFLGLHYPASDIPAPARAVFLETWVRIIPDVNYVPVALTSAESSPVDLGKLLLRAVSPVHIQYLKNMEVGATLTISLIVDGKLWGLIACHNLTPKVVDLKKRQLCEMIGRIVSGSISVVSLRETHMKSTALDTIRDRLTDRLSTSFSFSHELVHHTPDILDLMGLQGCSISVNLDGEWVSKGRPLDSHHLDGLVEWLENNHKEKPVFSTTILSRKFPTAASYSDRCSGLMAISIPKTSKCYILIYKPEVIHTVTWAGQPDKAPDPETGRLSPRQSFESWKTEVRGESLPWSPWELDAVRSLRDVVLVADLKKQFKREQKAREEAEKAKLAREELMSVVSHDLKNPLASIMMNSQLIKKITDKDNFKIHHISDRVIRSSQIMNNLISDILSITKIDAGQYSLVKEKQNFTTVVEEAFEMMAPLAADKKINLHYDVHSSISDFFFDHDRILQVLSNLLGNAIKFTPERGDVKLEVTREGVSHIRAKVIDNGTGISPEDHLNVFDRFWQAKQSARFGSGLGLSIAKGIVEAHAGEIWVESEIDQGATFVFILPYEK